MLYPRDITCNLNRWNKGGSDIFKKLKHFEKIVVFKKFYIIFNFLSLCVFISVQNIGSSILLIRLFHGRKKDRKIDHIHKSYLNIKHIKFLTACLMMIKK